MMNYKGLTFPNTTEGFKRWSKEFPPLEKPVKTAYQKHENYYLELQLVEGFLNSDPFIHASVREYNANDQDFTTIDNETEEKLINSVFKNKVNNFKAKYGK